MTNKAGARRAQENLYVARQSAASAAFGQRQAALRQRTLLAKAREARALAASKAKAKADAEAAKQAPAARPTRTAKAQRPIAASPETIFEAWIHAETLRAFYGAAGEKLGLGELVAAFVDARVGGGFRLEWRRAGKRVEQRSTYLELSSPTRVVFGWDGARSADERVTITIRRSGAGCEVELSHALAPDFTGDPAPLTAACEATLTALASSIEGKR